MKISLVIPNYNSGNIIERAISSVVSQNYPDLELILVDGGSTDESIRICREHADLFSVFVSEPDAGIADALNKGFARASGDLFGWLAADDELAPGALHHWNELFQRHPEVDAITGGCLRVFEDGSTLITTPRADVMQRITFNNGIEQPSTLWRAGLHRRIGALDTSYKLAFDWDLWCRFRKAGARVMPIDRVMSHYHFSATNLTSSSGEKLMREMFRVVRTHGPYFGLVAYVYLALFKYFDLHGCFDKPKTWSLRRAALRVFLGFLYVIFTPRIIRAYNWKFISRQMRGLVWFRR
ncbi:MAG: glycosyltransferase family 2 protein [Parvibaculum sp.]|uniref:glycosyltransferase family 2 protein n=1 Tax=Parvibaculum sp. TaxID=2024848 RepID=UPI003C735360